MNFHAIVSTAMVRGTALSLPQLLIFDGIQVPIPPALLVLLAGLMANTNSIPTVP